MSAPQPTPPVHAQTEAPSQVGTQIITGPCPHCRGVIDMPGPPFAEGFQCDSCEKVFAVEVSEGLQKAETPDRCIFCADTDFYVEKDMPRGLGLFLVVMAAALVPFTQGISIIVVAFVQVPFFLLLKMRHVCYGCQALYRRFPTSASSRPFDHELATMRELAREKAEAKALREAEAAAAETPPPSPEASGDENAST